MKVNHRAGESYSLDKPIVHVLTCFICATRDVQTKKSPYLLLITRTSVGQICFGFQASHVQGIVRCFRKNLLSAAITYQPTKEPCRMRSAVVTAIRRKEGLRNILLTRIVLENRALKEMAHPSASNQGKTRHAMLAASSRMKPSSITRGTTERPIRAAPKLIRCKNSGCVAWIARECFARMRVQSDIPAAEDTTNPDTIKPKYRNPLSSEFRL